MTKTNYSSLDSCSAIACGPVLSKSSSDLFTETLKANKSDNLCSYHLRHKGCNSYFELCQSSLISIIKFIDNNINIYDSNRSPRKINFKINLMIYSKFSFVHLVKFRTTLLLEKTRVYSSLEHFA